MINNVRNLILLISFILTLSVVLIANIVYLDRLPVDVKLNISGSQTIKMIVSLGSSKKDKAYINNTLVLHPTSDKVMITYPIKKTYPVMKFHLLRFLILFVILYGVFYVFIHSLKYFKNFVKFLWAKQCSHNLNLCCLSVSISIILFLFTLFLLSYIGFICHIPIQKTYIVIATLIDIVFLYFFDKFNSLPQKYTLFQVSLLLLIFISSCLFATIFYDSSWDGRSYHQEIIILLTNGWNPVFEKPQSLYFNPMIWVEHYTKCAEILSANFVTLFKNIEIGKAINFLFASNVFLLTFFTFNKFKTSNMLISLAMSILIILNPVALCQIKTYYVDLLVYYLFVIILFAIILKEKCFINNKLFSFFLIAGISLLCNIKLGGIFYSVLLLLSYYVYSFINKNYKNIKLLTFITLFSGILILISGINPYYTNIKQGYNLIYPLAGEGKIDIMTRNSPKSFEHKNSIYKLFISTFADTKNILYNSNESPKLKIPFSLINQEKLSCYDMRIAGFGYFWSGILLLLIPFVILFKNSKGEDNSLYYYIVSILWLSVLLNPHSWWARYAPQFWLIPIFVIFWKLLTQDKTKKFTYFSTTLIILLFINSLIIETQVNRDSIIFTKNRISFFNEVANKDIDIYLSEHNFEQTIYYKLNKLNTSYHIIKPDEYFKNSTAFKIIPYLLIDGTGEYKINE